MQKFFLVKDVYVLVIHLLSTCNYISTVGKKKWESSACIVFIFIFILIISIIYLEDPLLISANIYESSLLKREKLSNQCFSALEFSEKNR